MDATPRRRVEKHEPPDGFPLPPEGEKVEVEGTPPGGEGLEVEGVGWPSVARDEERGTTA